MKKSTILHLRFPFSFFLLPIFLFAIAVQGATDIVAIASVFSMLHFMVYPASNGYNSFFDRDKGSIGGLKNPPAVTRELYWVSLALDGLALVWAAYLSITFSVMLLIYGFVSKAYSHPVIRLKRFAFRGWLTAGFFQGYFTFIAIIVGVSEIDLWSIPLSHHLAGALSSMLLFGSYPMTQIYQHEEDLRRGDITISSKLGILGTFHFTAVFFSLSVILFSLYFIQVRGLDTALLFGAALLPVLGYFVWWYTRVRLDQVKADYQHTMWLNFISSGCLTLFFLYLYLA